MGNMSYCRFRNTLQDLRDCYDHINEISELSDDEEKAKTRLIDLCSQIAEDFDMRGDDDEND